MSCSTAFSFSEKNSDNFFRNVDFHCLSAASSNAEMSSLKGRPRELRGRWRHLALKFGAMLANNLTTDDVRHYIRERQQEGASNATINRELAALKRMLNFGRQSTPPRSEPFLTSRR